MARGNQYITEVRKHTKALWLAWEGLMEAQREWNALDYGNTLPDGGPGPFPDDNTGITRDEVGAVVFDTANAIKTVMDAGNATNVAKLL